jgi:release factor glutamine methyltransferase
VALADLMGPFKQRLHQAVDLLLFNPPYVPSPPGEVGGPRLSAAWARGERGRQVLDRLLPCLPGLLAPRGAAHLVAVPANDVPQLLDHLALLGLPAEVCLTRVADEERLMVIRAFKPEHPPSLGVAVDLGEVGKKDSSGSQHALLPATSDLGGV